uniref:Disease resistance N-terminal domain-containing protein n=1 Tax=Oryza rufipogon TaxID=4529 RepID=A0A0E0R6U1_ORYRU
MNTVMQKYAMLSEPDLQVKAWMKEVRELAYDIEDTIDAFMARSEKSNEPTGIRGFIINNILKLRELLSSCTISQEIEKLKNQVLEVNDRRKRYLVSIQLDCFM